MIPADGVEATPQAPTLAQSDRCDRCGSQAAILALFPSGALLFCAHHWRRHELAARAQGALVVVDDRSW